MAIDPVVVDRMRAIANEAVRFESEAHAILSRYEASASRVISVDNTLRRLANLSIEQDNLFQEALLCVKTGTYRAAHVMAWAAFMDFLERALFAHGLEKVRQIKSGWSKFTTLEELRESVPEFQIIEAAREAGLLSKAEMKTIHGLLSKRNECAHPSTYHPGLNETLGYISELLNRIENLEKKGRLP